MPNITSSDRVPIRQTVTTLSYHPVNGLTQTTSIGVLNPGREVRYKSKTWVRTVNYRALKTAKAVLPNNAFSHFGYQLRYGGASASLPTNSIAGSWYKINISYTGPVAAVAVSDSFSYNINGLKFAMIKKAKGNQWDVPVFVAEGRKTVEMVVDTATRLVRMGAALRRGRFGDFIALAHPSSRIKVNSESLKRAYGRDFARYGQTAAASWWLQMQYGWKPFIGDVRNAVNTLMDVVEMPDRRIGRVRARYTESFHDVSPESALLIDEANGLYVYGKTYRDIACAQKGTWNFTVNPSDLPGRFGLLNPLQVAWELVPLSFVADWFVPIGDYLSALDVPMRYNSLGGTYGVLTTLNAVTAYTRHTPVKAQVTGFSGGCTSKRAQRTPFSTPPDPSLSAMVFRPEIGAERAVSAIALLHTFFGKLGR